MWIILCQELVWKNRSFVRLYSITAPSVLKIKWHLKKNKQTFLWLEFQSWLSQVPSFWTKEKGESNSMKTRSPIRDSSSIVLATAHAAKIHTGRLNRKNPNNIILLTCDYENNESVVLCLNISIYGNKQRLITWCCLRIINNKCNFVTKEFCIP